MKNIITIYIKAKLNVIQLSIYQKRKKKDLQQKTISCKCLQLFDIGLGFTKEHVEIMQAKKEKQAQADKVKKICNNFLKICRKKKR